MQKKYISHTTFTTFTNNALSAENWKIDRRIATIYRNFSKTVPTFADYLPRISKEHCWLNSSLVLRCEIRWIRFTSTDTFSYTFTYTLTASGDVKLNPCDLQTLR